jgi:hypothetical protein
MVREIAKKDERAGRGQGILEGPGDVFGTRVLFEVHICTRQSGEGAVSNLLGWWGKLNDRNAKCFWST